MFPVFLIVSAGVFGKMRGGGYENSISTDAGTIGKGMSKKVCK